MKGAECVSVRYSVRSADPSSEWTWLVRYDLPVIATSSTRFQFGGKKHDSIDTRANQGRGN